LGRDVDSADQEQVFVRETDYFTDGVFDELIRVVVFADGDQSDFVAAEALDDVQSRSFADNDYRALELARAVLIVQTFQVHEVISVSLDSLDHGPEEVVIGEEERIVHRTVVQEDTSVEVERER
jgi:hypothetical protein